MSKKSKWRDDPKLCNWCFESMDRFQMYFCSEYCKNEAKLFKERQDNLAKDQDKAKHDLLRHNAEFMGDAPDDYPIEGGNLNG